MTILDSAKFGAGGKQYGPSISVPFFTSGTFTAPQNGLLTIRAMGGGGGGARASAGSGTGGYSGSWGAKILRVSKGDVVTISVGAAGVGKTTTDGNGGAGGNTTVTVGGVTRTAPGGSGGVWVASGVPTVPNGPAWPATDWDFGADSVKPGAAAVGKTGGAGVDILAQGNNATTSASVDLSCGGGTGGPSIGVSIGGGALANGADILGNIPSNAAGTAVASAITEWVASFYGGSGATAASQKGGNGGGGGTASGPGGNGGGGGGGSGTGGVGGIGGGGGGGAGAGGNGGAGFVAISFAADTGV